jgi:hypothetical protein
MVLNFIALCVFIWGVINVKKDIELLISKFRYSKGE